MQPGAGARSGRRPGRRDADATADALAGDALAADAADLTDGPLDARCPAPTTRVFPVGADTIIRTNDSQPHGDISVMNVSAQLGSQALLAFDVSGLPTAENVVAARLTLPYPAKATACSPSCGDCADLETTGAMTVQFLRTDWTETATWTSRGGTATWTSQGAAALGADRSALTAAFSHTATTATIVTLPPALLADWENWRRNDRLAFVIAPGTGRAVIATREYRTVETCDPALGGPTLEVDSCP